VFFDHCVSRLALKIVIMARQEAKGKRQKARVKKFRAILLFSIPYSLFLSLFFIHF